MSKIINQHFHMHQIIEATQEATAQGYNNLAKLFSYISNNNSIYKVRLYCNWCDSKELANTWNKMSKGNYKWNNIRLVWEEPADYYVVINAPPPRIQIPKEKTIIFRMEPHMDKHPNMWGEWAAPNENEFMFVGYHSTHYNNNEWHLSKSFNQLNSEKIIKSCNILSTVLSDKYHDPGHKKRIDFVKFLEQKGLSVYVWGSNKFKWNTYKGRLPPHQKDDALLPFKYTFNVENNSIKGYFTEKIIDGILAECLTFYHGCPNIAEYIDERAFFWLDLEDFESDFNKIVKAMEDDIWVERLPYIRAAKNKILNETQFFPRIEKIIMSNNKI